MSDRCEPPPELRGQDGWHWLRHDQRDKTTCRQWVMGPQTPGWRIGPYFYTAEDADMRGWRYLAPVTPPDVVERLRADLARLVEAATPFCCNRLCGAVGCGQDVCAYRTVTATLAAIKERTP